ncbi:hypothetical protein [Roseomonas sp. CECT 9278]|uniref:hypothetical protein n=1 Tax=Roseomonas sp. CECT 9278 TaxID=2845823 RepID=UPI001E6494A5|nr:hypothetical protein [Roseomonas sp. CECT 9278]CAH0157000.1 hypothetical protein ROS9278_00866 [Roseomonas sp. CECT 9278]
MTAPRRLTIACLALALSAGAAGASVVLRTQERCQVAGPFVTLVDATEAARAARERGANPVTFRTGEGYFVRAC